MEATKPAVSLVLFFGVLCGCKAQPGEQKDAAVRDLSVDGGEEDDLAGVDLYGTVDLACPAAAAEICGNGCDDDRNQLTDDEDPACTPQVLVTWHVANMLQRLMLRPPYLTGFVDGNTLPTTARAVYSRSFAAGIAFVAVDGPAQQLLRITLPSGMGQGAIEVIDKSYFLRDVCVFNGELIVVERTGSLRRVAADGKTEMGTVVLPAWMPSSTTLLTSCASDGTRLYVSGHVGGAPSQFEVLDTSFAPMASPIPIPDALLNQGIDRCLDFAWTRGGFYGLFISSGGNVGDTFPAYQITPFALDGGVGAPIDAGAMYGIGDYVP
jgi:hypothetical protein